MSRATSADDDLEGGELRELTENEQQGRDVNPAAGAPKGRPASRERGPARDRSTRSRRAAEALLRHAGASPAAPALPPSGCIAVEVRFSSWRVFQLTHRVDLRRGIVRFQLEQSPPAGAPIKVMLRLPDGRGTLIEATIEQATKSGSESARFDVSAVFDEHRYETTLSEAAAARD